MTKMLPPWTAQTLSIEDITVKLKKQEMEVHQACIGEIVHELNKFSRWEGSWMFSV